MADECTNIVECCPPDPFVAVGGSAEPSDQGCGQQECCASPVFSLIPDKLGFPICESLDDFTVWFEGVPTLCTSGDLDFGIWFEGAPFVEKSDIY